MSDAPVIAGTLNAYPDDTPELRKIGDESVSPVGPASDNPGEPPAVPVAIGKTPVRLIEPVYAAAVAQNADVTVGVEFQPDFWTVTTPYADGVEIDIHMGSGRRVRPVAKLGPGGFARLIGRDRFVTLTGIGATSATCQVVAYQGWGDISPETVLIVPVGGTPTP